LEKIFNTFSKFDMDFIPGLDGEEKCIIMPGAYETALKEGIEKQKQKEREKLLEAGGVVEVPKEVSEEKKDEIKIPVPTIPKVVVPPSSDEEPTGPKPMVPYSCCFILGPKNPLKIKIHKFATHPWFDGFIMLIIGASSIALASEDPVDENAQINIILNKIDYFFTAVFTFEMLTKMVDLGIICHPGSYFRDIWNALDFVVVSCALFSYIFSGSEAAAKNLSTMKSLRVLRVLRPLKTIKKIPKLKAVLDCVIISLQNVFNIMVVYILFMFIFAVVAVQLFKGRFFYCNDLSKRTEGECLGQYYVYDEDGHPSIEDRSWNRWEFHYDNVVFAFLTLFTIQTGEGWPQILEHSLDITTVDHGPVPGNRMV
jgi:voltage-dependent calcium channel N type alpha-1B